MRPKPKVLSSHLPYQGFFDVKEDRLERADGETLLYASLLLSTHATVILGQDREGNWILNREYRHPVGEYILGCPGGRLEKGENPWIGGQREFFEETGYWSDEITLLGSCYSMPAICDQKIYFLWAKNAYKKEKQKLDPFEFIEIELKSDAVLRQMLKTDSNIDSLVFTALWYKDHFDLFSRQ